MTSAQPGYFVGEYQSVTVFYLPVRRDVHVAKDSIAVVNFKSGFVWHFNTFKIVVLDWPLNICTYNSCQKQFPKDICKLLQSYTIACLSISTSKLDFKTQNLQRSQWGFINCSTLKTVISNFDTVKTFKIHYFIIKSLGKFGRGYLGINIV